MKKDIDTKDIEKESTFEKMKPKTKKRIAIASAALVITTLISIAVVTNSYANEQQTKAIAEAEAEEEAKTPDIKPEDLVSAVKDKAEEDTEEEKELKVAKSDQESSFEDKEYAINKEIDQVLGDRYKTKTTTEATTTDTTEKTIVASTNTDQSDNKDRDLPSNNTDGLTTPPEDEVPVAEEPVEDEPATTEAIQYSWDGSILTKEKGVNYGPQGKETYYNLDMSGVVSTMRGMGFTEEEYPYWVREDGCKMLGNYIMVAANLNTFPRGTTVECSLGTALVCDTGGFAANNATQLDIATNW